MCPCIRLTNLSSGKKIPVILHLSRLIFFFTKSFVENRTSKYLAFIYNWRKYIQFCFPTGKSLDWLQAPYWY